MKVGWAVESPKLIMDNSFKIAGQLIAYGHRRLGLINAQSPPLSAALLFYVDR